MASFEWNLRTEKEQNIIITIASAKHNHPHLNSLGDTETSEKDCKIWCEEFVVVYAIEMMRMKLNQHHQRSFLEKWERDLAGLKSRQT
jgi:hypothetical protein